MNVVSKDLLRLIAPPEPQPPAAVDRALLKSSILQACKHFEEAVANGDKEYLRKLHLQARGLADPGLNSRLLKLYGKRKGFFADGDQINIKKVCPELIYVEPHSVWEDVFKIVRGTWSMPYSKGYGRRLRFVVYDSNHEAVIGIIGFQSPAADLACRDELIKVDKSKKLKLVNSTLDVYTIGAIPPYSYFLGGKLVAGLSAANNVRYQYKRVYGGRMTQMDSKKISGNLIALTTASAFGRSSIYNRLRYGADLLAKPIGYTKGYGSVHLEHLYDDLLKVLKEDRKDVSTGGFGVGPKIRWQNFTRGLQLLGLPGKCLQHGLKREVFLFPLVKNLEAVFAGDAPKSPLRLSVDAYTDYWRERWAIPRATRDTRWESFKADEFFLSAFSDQVIGVQELADAVEGAQE